MRKIIARIFICICFISCMMPEMLNAQKNKPLNMPLYDNEPYHFGYIIGYNQMWFSPKFVTNFQNIEYDGKEGSAYFDQLNDTISINSKYNINDISQSLPFGMSVGVVGNLRLAKYFDLRLIPTISWGETSITYKGKSLGTEKEFSQTFSIHNVYLELPLQFKYRSKRYNNTAAYVIFGANNKINFTAKKFDIKLKRYDFAPEIGTGFDFYTGEFKFGIEIKMSYGLRNMIDPENLTPLTNSFDKLKNKMFQLSFTLE